MTEQNTNAAAETNGNATEGTTGSEPKVLLVDDVCVVIPGADATEGLTAPVLIGKPPAGENIEISLQPGQKYIFDFQEGDVQSFIQQDSDLNITFADGSTVTLLNFAEATGSALPASLAFSDQFDTDQIEVVDTTPDENELEDPQSEIREEQVTETTDTQGESDGSDVASIQPAAGDEPTAQQIAQIEPAAGDEATTLGGTENSGQGAFSSFDPQGVIPINAVGPIDPTKLQYGVEFQNDTLYPQEREDTPVDGNPILLSPAANTLDESFLGPLSVSDTLSVDFGTDGPGAITPTGVSSVSGSSVGGATLLSGGQPVTITPTADGYVGTLPGGAQVFTLTVDPQSGDYTFTQILPIDHADATDANDVITLTFGVQASDSDGDLADAQIVINIADDAPAIAAPDSNTYNENALSGGPIVINDTLVVDFGNDAPGTVTPGGTGTFSGVTNLTSGGDAITITPTANGYVGTLAGGGTAFELVINPANGAYTFTQFAPLDHDAVGDTITLDFPVDVTDFDGDTTETNISVNIIDSVPTINTNPKVGDGLEIVDESDLPGVNVKGQITTNFGADTPGTVEANGSFDSAGSKLGGNLTSNGQPVNVELVGDTYIGYTGADVATGTQIFTLQIDDDGCYRFNLLGTLDHADPNDPNDIIDLEFGVVAKDNDGDTAESTIIIKVKDDVPVIGNKAGDVDESDLDVGPISTSDTLFTSLGTEATSFTPDGGVRAEVGGNPITLTAGGETVTFTQTPDGYEGSTPSGGTIFTLVMDPVTGKYTYTQVAPFDHPDGTDPNDTIELFFGFEVANNDGDTDTGTVEISVADDGPIANDDFNGAAEGQTITGNVITNDDLSEDVTNTVTEVQFGGNTFPVSAGTPAVITTPLGTLTINSDGTYEFDAVDSGDPDGTVNFTYTLTDGDNDSDPANLSIRVTPDGEPVAVNADNTVDETNLTPGPLAINETLNVDFGIDGAGSISPNGSTSFGGSVAAGNLTSNDTPVEIRTTANGYEGVLQGTNTQVFELIVQDNGDYSFELFAPLDHADGADPNDTIVLNFGVDVADFGGDVAPGKITINVLDDAPIAKDDQTTYDTTTGTANGNVIANDDLSEDNAAPESADHDVVQIRFGTTTVDVPAGGTASIDGDFGTLTIADNGTYTYTLNPGATLPGTTTSTLDPESADVAGTQTSFTNNGITVTSTNGKDLTWWNGIGPGVGVGGDQKVYPSNDALNVDFDPASTVEIKIGDIGSNNVNSSLRFDLNFEDGSNETIIFDIGSTTVVDGIVTVSFDSADYGGKLITSVDLPYYRSSFVLSDVTVTHEGEDCVIDQFEYVLQDGDGDQSVAELKLIGKDLTDDEPELETSAVTVDETDIDGEAPTGEDSASNSVTADFGADTPGEYALNSLTGFNGALNNQLTSNGVAVNVNNEGGDLVGRAGGDEVFRLELNEQTGQYTFTLVGTLDHADGTNPDDVIQLFFEVQAEDSDGDTDTGTITVNVKDDGPYIDSKARPIDEDGLANNGGPISYTHTLNHDYGEDGAGEIRPTDNFSAKFQVGGQDQQITADGVPVTVSATANGYEGVANGETIFTLTVNNNGEYTYTQFKAIDHPDASNHDDVIWLKFGVEIVDYDGDTDQATIIVDLHDGGPDAHDDCITIGQNKTTFQGNVIDNDQEGPDVDATVTNVRFNNADYPVVAGNPTVVNGQYGTLTINTDGSYSYAVNGTNSTVVRDIFTYTLTDADGDSDTATLKVIIEDVNDNPEVEGSAVTVDETDIDGEAPLGEDSASNSVTGDFGADGPGTYALNDLTSFNGALNNQLTSNGVAVNVNNEGGDLVGRAGGDEVFRLELNEQTGQYTFTLVGTLDHADSTNPDDVIQLLFQVTGTDEDGDTDTGTITVNVKDDGPYIVERATSFWEGNLITNDSFSVTRTLDHGYGEDGPGEIRPTGDFVSLHQVGGTAQTVTSNGVEVIVSATANGYQGVTTEGKLVFTLSVDNNGEYTYTQHEGIDHPDPNDPLEVTWLKFGVEIVDYDGDTAVTNIIIDVRDSGPDAEDDCIKFNAQDGALEGNVVDNDTESGDKDSTVTQVKFGNETFDVPANGADTVINGDYGQLTINSSGEYSYEAYDYTFGQQTTYSLSLDNPPGGDAGGDIKHINTTYSEDTQEFSFTLTVSDISEGFTLAINHGGNPKGHSAEMAMVYFDASGAEPVVNVYAYNGLNLSTSWTDGSSENGIQAPDAIANSIANSDLFSNITQSVDANGNKVFSFTMDASIVQDHTPAHGPANEWTGLSFSENAGMWLHTVKNIESEYGNDGFLTNWSTSGGQGYYDSVCDPTEVITTCLSETVESLNVEASDVAGTQTSITKNGITVTSTSGEDLSWYTGGGTGVGVGSDGKVWPNNDALNVSFDGADSVTFTIGDIGYNNLYSQLRFDLHFTDGSSETVIFDISTTTPVDEKIDVTFNASDFGGRQIEGADLPVYGTSFILNNVTTKTCSECVEDQFEYVLTDADGDSDTAALKIAITNGPVTEDTDTNTDVTINNEINIDVNAEATATAEAEANNGGTATAEAEATAEANVEVTVETTTNVDAPQGNVEITNDIDIDANANAEATATAEANANNGGTATAEANADANADVDIDVQTTTNVEGNAPQDVVIFNDIDIDVTAGATANANAGANTFIDNNAVDNLGIADLLQGYDALQESINDFVFATTEAATTTNSVGTDGADATATQIAVLEAVTGLDLGEITENTDTTTL